MNTSINNLNQDQLDKLRSALTPRLNKYIPINPTPKQRAFLLLNDVREVLYGGAAGGGKSVSQLAAALQFVDVPGYNAILFRRTYADLALPGALIPMSREWLSKYVDSGEVHWSDKEKRYTFPTGATLSFGYLENSNDHYRYQGAEFQYVGVDEVTQIIPKSYEYMFSRMRKLSTANVPLRTRATANPGGEFGDYYYNRFFLEGKEKKRIFVPAGLNDNPHLDAEGYRESLAELDPVTRAQLEDGNWEIKASGDMFSRGWLILCEPMDIPTHARKVRYWDMASTDPKKQKKHAKDPDWTVGFKLAYDKGMYYIMDIIRVQKSAADVEKLIKETAAADGTSCAIRMEQEPGSSGEFTISYFSRKVLQGYNFAGVRSTGSKIERARMPAAAMQAGNIMISRLCRNPLAFYDELDTFPYGLHDDTIDGLSGAFTFFKPNSTRSAFPSSAIKSNGIWDNTRLNSGMGSTLR